jgi:hypothetical protein
MARWPLVLVSSTRVVTVKLWSVRTAERAAVTWPVEPFSATAVPPPASSAAPAAVTTPEYIRTSSMRPAQ